MRSTLLIAFLPAILCAAPALQIVKPVISQMEGGTPDPPGFDHVPAGRRAEAFLMNGKGWTAQVENIRRYVEK